MMSSSSNSTRIGTTQSSVHSKIGKKLKSGVVNRKVLNREKITSLQQDVEKLRKKLRLEESIHRALKRAFTRPHGTLPRLPPFLPPPILELLAEVAVLEEEIDQFEQQIVLCRQELHQETAFKSSSKTNLECSAEVRKHWQSKCQKSKSASCSVSKNQTGKENHFTATNPTISSLAIKTLIDQPRMSKSLEPQKLQESHTRSKTNTEQRSYGSCDEKTDPYKVSEDLVSCLSNILMRLSSETNNKVTKSQNNNKDTLFRDPYGISSRDIGQYKNLCDVEADSSLSLIRQLKYLLGGLSSVNLQKLNQQEKLAFWMNIYKSCMMNSFLEHGIPESSEMMVTLMQKATINVGGHFLNAITIENFILLLQDHLKSVYTSDKMEKKELEAAKREYVEASVGISMAKMGIPKLIDRYSHDLAKDIESLLDWICLQLPIE